jgi:hypothetical protein
MVCAIDLCDNRVTNPAGSLAWYTTLMEAANKSNHTATTSISAIPLPSLTFEANSTIESSITTTSKTPSKKSELKDALPSSLLPASVNGRSLLRAVFKLRFHLSSPAFIALLKEAHDVASLSSSSSTALSSLPLLVGAGSRQRLQDVSYSLLSWLLAGVHNRYILSISSPRFGRVVIP